MSPKFGEIIWRIRKIFKNIKYGVKIPRKSKDFSQTGSLICKCPEKIYEDFESITRKTWKKYPQILKKEYQKIHKKFFARNFIP